jgi:hypothetical protein
MKRIIFIITLTSMFLFQGCGESSNGEVVSKTTMSIGVEYSVTSGDVLTATSDDAQIVVTHTLSDGTKTVKLLSGSATLIKGNYES